MSYSKQLFGVILEALQTAIREIPEHEQKGALLVSYGMLIGTTVQTFEENTPLKGERVLAALFTSSLESFLQSRGKKPFPAHDLELITNQFQNLIRIVEGQNR